MRVKKLNTNRRPKAGEDDGGSTTTATDLESDHHQDQQEQQQQLADSSNNINSQWTTPSKQHLLPPSSPDSVPESGYRRVDAVDIGADSPTDPTASLLSSVAPPSELELNRHLATIHTMANAMATPSSTTTTTTTAAAMAMTGASTSSPSPSSSAAATAGSWRDQVSRALREAVHAKIVEYLTALKPHAPPKVVEKLPGLAYRMEDALFKLASCEAEYCDQTTLPQRLHLIQQANAKKLLQQQCSASSSAGSPRDSNNQLQQHNQQQQQSPSNNRKQPLQEEQARVVFSCLQSWRQKLVNMYGATPWEILSNQILAKVAVYTPSTTQELVVCGVPSDQLERFGNSLLQEIEKITNALNANANAAAAQQLHAAQAASSRATSPLTGANKRPSPSGCKPQGGAGSAAKSSSVAGNSANKKRKTGDQQQQAVRLAAAPTAAFLSAASFLTAASPATQTLLRPMDPAFMNSALPSPLPALLPSTASLSSHVMTTSTTNGGAGAARGGGNGGSLFPRIPVPRETTQQQLDQDSSRMHLLAQGVGQLSQQKEQQHTKDAYEKEIQTLRWLLQETQREKSVLEQEVQRLRQQGAK